jgi:hypothetical protein
MEQEEGLTPNINKKLIALSIIILIVVFFTYTKSFNNDIPTCDGYITNVYIYVLLGLLIACFSVLFIAKRQYAVTGTKTLIALGVSLVSIFAMYSLSPSQVLLTHLAWLTFIISISVTLYVVWRYTQYKGTITNTLIITILLVAGLTLFAHMRPDLISLSWGPILTIILATILLALLIPMLTGYNGMGVYYKGISALLVVVFMFLILYDTKLLRVKAETCVLPNYPADSLGLFLDIINMYTNVGNLS